MSTTAADDTVVEEAVVTDAVREAIAKAFAESEFHTSRNLAGFGLREVWLPSL